MTNKTDKKYSFTDHPEDRLQLEPIAQKWIANSISTAATTDDERIMGAEAIADLYRVSGMRPPAHVLFVSSPLCGALAGVAGSAWYWCRENRNHALEVFGQDVPDDNLRWIVAHAADHCFKEAQRHYRGEEVPGLAANSKATVAAYKARSPLGEAGEAVLRATGVSFPEDGTAPNQPITGTSEAAALLVAEAVILATQWWDRLYQGGCFWSGASAYFDFFRRVAKLDIDWSKWDPYERLSTLGPRLVHPEFAIISDRPELLTRDDRNRPHNLTGPCFRWRDGSELFYIHGVRVSARHFSADLSAKEISEERNAEVRRVLVERFCAGDTGRYFRELGGKVIHADLDAGGLPRRLLRIDQPDDEPIIAIEVTNHALEPDGTRKLYTFRCDSQLRPLPIPGVRAEFGAPQEMTCLNAIASTYGFTGETYRPASES